MKKKVKKEIVERFKSKIIGDGMENPDQLMANPGNYRIHPKYQQDVMLDMLDTVGWIQRIIVNKRTGHIVDGHLRAMLAIREGETEIPVIYVDLSDEEERIALAAMDPLSALAVVDQEKLGDLLNEVNLEYGEMGEFFDSLRDESEASKLKTPDGGHKGLGNAKHKLKFVIACDESYIIEQAIRKTGLMNRGDAIKLICEEYLEKGQHNAGEEMLIAGAVH